MRLRKADPRQRAHLAGELRRAPQTGTILVVVIVMCGIIGATLMAYLGMISAQERFVHRSAVWNNCIAMCEAGVEEAFAHINHRHTSSNFSINGWSYSSNAFRKARSLNEGRCEMTISTSYPPVITVSGKLPAPMNAGQVVRHVQVRTKVSRKFPQAILSKSKVTLGGNGRVDSFNSTNKLQSINGQYSELLATDQATVASLTRNTTDFNVGNVRIYGYVATGPGGTVSVGPQGNVGSKLFNDTPLFDGKIEAGHIADDFNVYIPDAAVPPDFGPGVPLGGAQTVDGVAYTYVAGKGDYAVGTFSMSTGQKLLVTGRARIFVSGNTTLTADAAIVLTTNATVEWYQAGSTVSMGGRGVVNGAGYAKNFQLIGLPTCTSVSYSGTAQFIGTVYAPSAAVVLTGSADAYGALVGNTIELSGGMGLHYDEALNAESQKARFVASSWQEIKL